MQIGDIKPKHLMKLFQSWTGNGLITRKDFNNRKSVLKALSWDNTNENVITIQHQLVEERILQEDMTLSEPQRILKNPKGNPYYSIRTEQLPQEGVSVLKKERTES